MKKVDEYNTKRMKEFNEKMIEKGKEINEEPEYKEESPTFPKKIKYEASNFKLIQI